RKKADRVATSPFLSRVVVCDDCGVFLCRGTNQGRPVLCCPRCRQTIGRIALDPYLVSRLLEERGSQLLGGSTVQRRWDAVGMNESARREILLTQVDSLRVRRGVVGRRFDEDRVLLEWRQPALQPAVV
ncbi:MAG: recombinase family protein, partial [Micrococcales bacterium]|nr:recombinase family protein [Micrococcales bacterium]